MSKYFLGGRWYRFYSRLVHKFNWHHATVCYLEDGAIQDWCQWCGLRANRINVTSKLFVSTASEQRIDKGKDDVTES